MTPDFDAIVIGAGVIGLALARELAVQGHGVLVLEKASKAGTETSSRNSEVIHAGIYYPRNTLKSQLCIEGRQLLYEFCERHGVATRRTGKLIVANSQQEEAKLSAIAGTAKENGVIDLAWLTPSDVASLEPEIRCRRAILSPSTGILDASAYMLALQGEAQAFGAIFAFNTQFKTARTQNGEFVVTAADSVGDSTEVSCSLLFNCAGHNAHQTATHVEGYPQKVLPPRFFAKGSYCSLSGRSPFRHLVYPTPVAGALGIHATLDLAGAVRFGPDISWIEELNYTIPDDLPRRFAAAVESYWPGVRHRLLVPSYCGVRPKLHGPDSVFADFLVQDPSVHGVPGLVNLFGIESPGLTASLAIARFAYASSQKLTGNADRRAV